MVRRRKRPQASVWTEEELLDGKRIRCLTIILRTSGCRWWRETGGCIMCGYNEAASDPTINEEEIALQFEQAWKSFDYHSIVKVYTSGSFLDEQEIPPLVRDAILKRAREADTKLLFESRPEFVDSEVMEQCLCLCPNIELALGLESANDEILSKSINKGLSFDGYLRAAQTTIDAGATVRTYVLLKPPYLAEQEAISDVLDSINRVSKYSRVISINPVNVQRRTPIEKLWNRWAYRPPWLWSVVEVLRRGAVAHSLLIASLVGAGSERGAHNCGCCDSDVIAAIDGFNLSQNKSKLDQPDCTCKERWRTLLSMDKFALSSGNHESFFTRDL